MSACSGKADRATMSAGSGSRGGRWVLATDEPEGAFVATVVLEAPQAAEQSPATSAAAQTSGLGRPRPHRKTSGLGRPRASELQPLANGSIQRPNIVVGYQFAGLEATLPTG
jgi:hypothetical protein